MDNLPHIVVIDDDEEILTLIADFLTKYDFRVSHFTNGSQVFDLIETDKIDLFILDKCLINEDGLVLATTIRQTSNVPIIMLTGVDESIEHSAALEAGIDSYITKPFIVRVLLAKIRALLRIGPQSADSQQIIQHSQQVANDQTVYCFCDWHLNVTTHILYNPDKTSITLSAAERELLHLFILNQGKVLSRDAILDLRDSDSFPDDRSVDVLVSRLRRKIIIAKDEPVIKTIRNIGYVFVPSVEKRIINDV